MLPLRVKILFPILLILVLTNCDEDECDRHSDCPGNQICLFSHSSYFDLFGPPSPVHECISVETRSCNDRLECQDCQGTLENGKPVTDWFCIKNQCLTDIYGVFSQTFPEEEEIFTCAGEATCDSSIELDGETAISIQQCQDACGSADNNDESGDFPGCPDGTEQLNPVDGYVQGGFCCR